MQNNSNGWSLVWSDQFSTLDKSKWKLQTGGGGWGNNELQFYTDRQENARIENGQLVIEARKQSYGGRGFTSARMNTGGIKAWAYGKVEAKIKLPTGKGIWPAFWMLGESIGQVGWPSCGEIDIMEHVNNQNQVHGNIHWNINGHVNYGKASHGLDVTQYHVYSIEWNDQLIKWYVDGTLYLEAKIANNVNSTTAFHKPFFIILNLAVGGNWPGNPDDSTQFPAKMYVDYVRVYQKGQGQPSGVFSIRSSANGKFVSAEDHGNSPLVANREMAKGWQYFQIINNQDGTISFLSEVNKKYVSANLHQGTKLIAQSTVIDTWQKFKKVDAGNGKVGLIALANNKYVSADLNSGSVLFANRDALKSWQTFTFTHV